MAVYWTAGYAAASLDMRHARILHTKLAGTVSASTEAEGRAAERADAVDTASWWLATAAPAWWQILYAAAETVDAVGIVAPDLIGVEISVEAEIGGVWTEVATHTPTAAGAILILFAAVECTGIRVNIDEAKRIAVIYTGEALQMLRMGYSSLGMIDLSRQAVLTSYISEGGQLLKRSIQRMGLAASYSWQNIPESWWRANGDAWAVAALTEPFFIAARPAGSASDCAYAWVDAAIIPERQGVLDFVSISIEAQAHV